LGEQLEQLRRPAAVAVSILAILAAALGFWFVRRHETALEDKADRALPGPPR
jgi:positive regulator of sigma E activity